MTRDDIADGLLVLFACVLMALGMVWIHTKAADASPSRQEFCLASDHTNTIEDCQ